MPDERGQCVDSGFDMRCLHGLLRGEREGQLGMRLVVLANA